MAHIYSQAYLGDQVLPLKQANLSIASSAVLYGLSVYTVFEIDARRIGGGTLGPVTQQLAGHYRNVLYGRDSRYRRLVAKL